VGRKKDKELLAREAVQRAEDSRLIAVQRQEVEQIAQERKRAQDKLDDAKKQAEAASIAQSTALRQTHQAEAEVDSLRSELMDRLNSILQTRATARGLIVNMSGVLFKNGKAELLPSAREKLSKIAGILSAHKGLKIEADGFTDSMGSDESNMRLSERRAQAAKDYLIGQGVATDSISCKGFGEENPIASNDTSAGRQENRRVELVVSGEGITAPSVAEF
jgi:outer membrane protein OmpA-like peptidoglycan-associated protein